MARSINRWPVLAAGSKDLAIGTVPGTTIRLRMRRDALPLFLALAAEYHRTVAPLRKGECGAYDYRQARASSSWSDHSSGTAMDLNWGHEGAQGARGGMATMSAAQIRACAALRSKYRVVIWGGDKARGGDYSQPRYWDPMHYALKPGTSSRDVAAAIKALRIRPDGTIAPAVKPKPRAGATTVTYPRGTEVRNDAARTARSVAHRAFGTRIWYRGTKVVAGETWLKTVGGNWVLAKRTARGD